MIDLLIIVAFIAILASIAIPNFLEAQVRLKVSRCHTGMRTVALALESYRNDHNGYPPYGAQDPDIHFGPGMEPQFLEPHWLTTPVAYLSSIAIMEDPLRKTDPPVGWPYDDIHWKLYSYVNFDDIRYKDVESLHRRFGEWRLTGCGPDGWRFNGAISGPDNILFALIIYDPTNGTVSIGDIYRTHKNPEPKYFSLF